jgi:hypothetical protein
MEKIKILVCTHKDGFVKSDDVFMPIQGGKAIADIDLGIQGDDTGENISAKNPHYCELTALYWAWKNLKDVDYIGLCHYRRYFIFSSLFLKDKIIASEDEFRNMKNTTFELTKHLGKYDIIMAKPTVYQWSLRVDYAICHHSEDYYLLKQVIDTHFPDYSYSFAKVIEYNNRISHYHMFITRWKVFDDYCKWLFLVMEELEKVIDYSSYSVLQARALAFMAERLFNVYVHKNKLKKKYYPIVKLTGDESMPPLLKYIPFRCKNELSFLCNRPLKKYFTYNNK